MPAIAAALDGKRPFADFSTNIIDSEVHDSHVIQPLHTVQSSANVMENSATVAIKTDAQSDMRAKVDSPSKQSPSSSLKKASKRSSVPVTKSHDGSPVGKRKEKTPVSAATQQVIAGMEELLPDNGDVLDFLSSNGISYIDKRSKGGVLWIIGGKELSPIIAKCKTLGFNFRFKAGGGRVTKGKDAWWAK